MNSDELTNFLKNCLRIEIGFNQSSAYWESNSIQVRLILDGDEISESTVTVPDWQQKESGGY